MKRLDKRSIGVTLLIAFAPAVCLAHHGLGGRYNQDIVVELEGEVAEVLWRNPHVRLTIVAPDETGELIPWAIESGSPTVLQRSGIVEGMVNVGDRVTVAGFSSMRGRDEMIAHNLLLPDGTELLLQGNRPPRWSEQPLGRGDFLQKTVGDSTAPELGIFRVWSTTVADPGSYPLFPEYFNPELTGRYPLTEEARATVNEFDPGTQNPMEAYCRSKGMPMIMEQPFPMAVS